MTPLARLVSSFLNERLPKELGASEHTRDSYAHALKLLAVFASNKLRTEPCKLQLEQLDAPLILDFLNHLEVDRGNGARTRNLRLSAIKSFMRFVQYRVPSSLEQVSNVLAIPSKRTVQPVIAYLTTDETKAVLNAPDPTTRYGIRDRAMLLIALELGLRVSELVGIRLEDLTLDPSPKLFIRGKGRRQAQMPLSPQTTKAVRAWLAVRGQPPVPELFLNARGLNMTRSGFEYVLAKHVAATVAQCPSLQNKRVSPHVLRHSCAMRALTATRDVRKVALWLRHSDPRTTEMYLHTEPGEKLHILNNLTPPSLPKGRFRPSDKLIDLIKAATICGARQEQAHVKPTL